MKKDKTHPNKFADLRQRAEETLQQKPEERTADWPQEIQNLVHELQVYQIELEIQNEELRRAQQELENSRDRFIDLYDFAPVGYVTLSEKGLILEANLTIAAMLGITRSELIKQPFSRFITREDQETYYLHLNELFKTSAPQVYDIRMANNDDSHFYARIEATVAHDNKDVPLCRIAISDDTARVVAEEALQAYSEQLEEMVEARTQELRDTQEQLVRHEKLAALGQLAGGVAHELRNPMGVLSNAVYFLQMTLVDTDECTREYLDIISTEVHKSEKIISDLLQFSRSRPTEREAVSVSDLIAPVLVEQCPSEEIELDTQISTKLPEVFVDILQIRQILTNLIVNACQAMLPDGGQLIISAKPKSDMVALSIRDTGCGIPKENMAKLFEPLFTTKARGIGLGLAVSKNLAETNGGSLFAESDGPGQGSTFTIMLPISVAAQ
jgi:PAS domain S-box-containing protein